ncbi:TPA: Rpn family recombination-promoting nuclease/putative transposase [Yersinia enterocolitica]|nr:Rpn family recombination-promoting nuclease/putative transposase [Yersinia enterocolitica]
MTEDQLKAAVGYTTEAKKFFKDLAHRLPQHEALIMTIVQEVEQQAAQEMALKIAHKMLINGFERNKVMRLTGLNDEVLTKTTTI